MHEHNINIIYIYSFLFLSATATMPPCKINASKRLPTLRRMTSSTLSKDDDAKSIMIDRTDSMAARAKDKTPFTTDEVRDIINSLHNITPKFANIDWEALEQLLLEVAHLSHKDWHVTGSNSAKMADILLPDNDGLNTNAHAQQILERCLHEGNWHQALAHANINNKLNKPWAVLVTGVNGIRKTSSIYQPWFSEVLKEALIPPNSSAGEEDDEIALKNLPNGDNSFFRQLDHMICTLCNEDFSTLYALTGAQLEDDKRPSKELIKQYSNLKASIFSRYRTLSELLGVLLLTEAQKHNINTMCETSGKDIAMFHYINHFFPDSYNKLALHFTINDLRFAKQSVDERMESEMMTGKASLESDDVVQLIYANIGGPYGSEVLEEVQKDSDRVWNEVIMNENEEGGVVKDWYKASMRINAYDIKPWTIQAVKADGSFGKEYIFGKPRTV